MKYSFSLMVFGKVLLKLAKPHFEDKKTIKEVEKEYKAIIKRASDIGSNNMLISSYALAALFIALNRKDGLTPEENISMMETEMRNSDLVKKLLGDGKSYFSEKKMEKRRKWSKETHEHKYKNDWVVDVIEKGDDFVFGLDYTECGVCKLCRDENCFHLAKYLCKLDFLLVELIGIKLNRTTTLADGGEKCDFRFSNK